LELKEDFFKEAVVKESMNLLTYHIYFSITLFICLQYINSFNFPFIRSHTIKSSSLSPPSSSPPSSSWLSSSKNTLLYRPLYPSTKLTTTTEASIIAPPKTDTKKKNDIKIDPLIKDNKNSNIQKLYEEFIEENNEEYMVILYDDPFNKRAYVASVLMDVFSWSEDMANSGKVQ